MFHLPLVAPSGPPVACALGAVGDSFPRRHGVESHKYIHRPLPEDSLMEAARSGNGMASLASAWLPPVRALPGPPAFLARLSGSVHTRETTEHPSSRDRIKAVACVHFLSRHHFIFCCWTTSNYSVCRGQILGLNDDSIRILGNGGS